MHPRDNEWEELSKIFDDYVGLRQYFKMNIELVQTSCGYAVPLYEFKSERESLLKWANNHGQDGIEDYWKEKNQISLDGRETNIITSP